MATRTDSARLRELFDQALDLRPEERGAFLDRACGEDRALRGELAALLAHDQGSFAAALDEASALVAPPESALPAPGELLAGRYEILRELGRGGMGVVFEAEQKEPRRRVALKCLNPATFGADLAARFRREGEALARLRHPGIAQVFEAFVVEEPRPQPFLALELVEGVPLDELATKLDLRARLELCAAVCDALAHAHARGVVHRDLKPANILVECGVENPRAKILDFGLARLVDASESEVLTRDHSLMGTLAYLAPELLEHGSADADARSDVWSMGVILYQVLSGRLPLPIEGLSFARATRVVLEQEPSRLEQVAPALRGDVAIVVHHALEKEPARRYAGAAELRDDLRRILAGEPILARAPSSLYRARLFVRRHRALVAGALATLLALCGGLIAALVLAERARDERARAERRADELRELVASLVLELEPALAELPGATTARELVLRTGLRFAEGLATEVGNDAALASEVAHALAVLAKVQSGPGPNHLGDYAGGARTLERALEVNARARALQPADARFLVQRIGLLLQRSAALRASGDAAGGSAALALAIREAEALDAQASSPDVHRVRAYASSHRARALADRGEWAAAREALEPLESSLRAELARREDLFERHELSALLRHRAFWSLQSGELEIAEAEFGASVEEAQRAFEVASARKDREVPVAVRGALAEALQGRATFYLERRSDPAHAQPDLERARELLLPLVEADAADRALARVLALVHLGLARVYELGQRPDLALAEIEAFRVDADRRCVAAPGELEAERDALVARQIEGRLLTRLQRDADSDRVLAEALERARAALARQPDAALAADDLVVTLSGVADVHLKRSERAGVDPEVQVEEWDAAARWFAEQEQLVRELDGRGLLAPARGHLLEKLPQWIGRLEAAVAGRR
ncbi:MAG: serine/threonine protein kinase [Planctomycetes bacterium]|nr:serine/threonine protein kinase [Planctomycetota bacterium]